MALLWTASFRELIKKHQRGGSLIFLIGLFFFGLSSCERKSENEEIFDKYYEPYQFELDEESLAAEPKLIPAYAAYREGDYETVRKLTTDFLRNDARLPLVMLAQAISFLELDSNAQALKNFEILEAHPVFGDEATFYRALTLIRLGRRQEALSSLSEVSRYQDEELTKKAATLMLSLQKK